MRIPFEIDNGGLFFKDEIKCKQCFRKDGADLPFPEVWELNKDGVCNICEQSFNTYKTKQNEKTK